jgi:hypothetical protein
MGYGILRPEPLDQARGLRLWTGIKNGGAEGRRRTSNAQLRTLKRGEVGRGGWGADGWERDAVGGWHSRLYNVGWRLAWLVGCGRRSILKWALAGPRVAGIEVGSGSPARQPR